MNPESEDSRLMLRLQNGEDTALNELMSRWQNPLASFIFRYVGRQPEALDLAQETFVKVYQSRATYKPTAKFSSWLFTIASNLCKNHLRWRSRHSTVDLTTGDEGDSESPNGPADRFPSAGRTPSESAEQNDLTRLLAAEIQNLPHDLKTVVLLFEYQDLSYEEVGTALGCSSKAVETRLYRAKKILRERLERLSAGHFAELH